MQSLQEYLIYQYEYNDSVQEGKVWDAIKGWFKDLFKSADNLEFDRYNTNNDFTGEKLEKYKKYIKDNFKEKNCIVKLVDKKSLKNIIEPNGQKPNEESKIGFYKFIDIFEKKIKESYYAIIYQDNQVKDVVCLISVIKKDNIIEIKKYQVIEEYINILPLKSAIKIFTKDSVFTKDINIIICKEKTDKNLYNQLINDCKFEKDVQDNENIAKLKLDNVR